MKSCVIRISRELRSEIGRLGRKGETYDDVIRRLMKDAESKLGPNELCPRGWAWLIGDCDFGQDCLRCTEDLAPILKEKKEAEGR